MNFPPKSPRSLSAIWFGFVAYIVVLIIFRIQIPPTAYYFFILQIAPIITAGLVGFIFGNQITNSEKVSGPIEAVVFGIKVSVITYFAYLVIAYFLIAIDSIIGEQDLRIASRVYVVSYVTFYYGWLIIAAGAAAGLLLYKLLQQIHSD
jgi:hypothetical protein